MAQSINLDNLLRSIHNSILEAQKLTEQQHIRQLSNYFEWPDDIKDITLQTKLIGGKARTWNIDVPNPNPESKEETITIKVPIMSLIPPTAIKIKNMVVDFKVALKGFEDIKKKAKQFTPGDPTEHRGPLLIDMGGISGDSFYKDDAILANIRIEFKSGQPSESFLRINDHLIKSII